MQADILRNLACVAALRVGAGEGLQLPNVIFRAWRSPANACNPLAKDLSIKEMLNFRDKDSRWPTVARGYIQTSIQTLFPNPRRGFSEK